MEQNPGLDYLPFGGETPGRSHELSLAVPALGGALSSGERDLAKGRHVTRESLSFCPIKKQCGVNFHGPFGGGIYVHPSLFRWHPINGHRNVGP